MVPVGLVMDMRTGAVLAEFDEVSIQRDLMNDESRIDVKMRYDPFIQPRPFPADWMTCGSVVGLYIRIRGTAQLIKAICRSVAISNNEMAGIITVNLSFISTGRGERW